MGQRSSAALPLPDATGSHTLRRKAPSLKRRTQHAANDPDYCPISRIFFLSLFLYHHPPFTPHDTSRHVSRPPRREARGGQRSADGNRGASRRERAAPRAERRRRVRG